VDIAVPRSGPDDVRIMSYNVLKSKPLSKPDTFKRIFEAVNPDIVLVQEWDGDAAVLRSWFNSLIPSATSWSVVASPGGDVAIISKHGTFQFGSEAANAVEPMPGKKQPWKPRWVGAIVDTPVGKFAIGTVHLKCCGAAGSPEDELRKREAESINEAMAAGLTQTPTNMVILGGDMNLVGSRPPLDILRAQLDHGNDLLVIDPSVLGDTVKYTWVDSQSEFSAGRLDYLTYSSSTMELSRAFVLDTEIMTDEALFRSGLSREDTLGSDHLPVVIDVRPLPAGMMDAGKK
jgi:endonuclease/exonuclease/phosphatase family metal-dependent hydrolase